MNHIRNCNHCQLPYEYNPSYIARGEGTYCSRACSVTGSSLKRKKKHAPNVECAICSVCFWKKPSQLTRSKSGLHFCSKECKSKAFKTEIIHCGPKKNPLIVYKKQKEKLPCRICSRPVLISEYKDIHLNCIKIEKWLSGDNNCTLSFSKNGIPRDTKDFVKKYLIKTKGNRCQNCGFDKKTTTGRSIIQMDHINGNCFDNQIENLRLLCPNCHAMTNNYGSLNKGSGRLLRRKNFTSAE